MNGAYKIVDAIQWHEGMLLTPQHFQQLSLRQEQLLQYTTQMTVPFAWGIRYLKIDPVLLVNGQLCVLELEALMPDGLIVNHDARADEELTLDLTEHLETIKQQPLMVYLAVPSYSSQLLADERYYSIEGPPVMDMNTGEGRLTIPRLKPKLRLLTGEAPSSKFIFFPLTQVAYKNETFVLTEFIPPTLFVTTPSALGDMLVSIITRAREKAAFLSERLRSPAYVTRMNKPMLFDTQNVLQGLVSMLPQIEAMLYAQASHPYPLYLSLCALAGNMATFTSGLLPPVFDAYAHNDLYATFTPVCTFIHHVLDHIHESYSVYPFHYKDQHFTLTLEPEWVQKRYFVIGARIANNSSEAELIEWMNACLIGSDDKVASMVERRILGAKRAHIEHEEDLDLIAPRGVVLFRVDVDGQFVQPEQGLHIFSEYDSQHQPLEIVFYLKIET
ncbi:MAG: type VI secretion system baseplate subunit TssK [Pseudomonadota bacterium]|nr:type VI secretion system baseplate subunit TssK [Pseudomonadota bacterium]